MTSRITLRAWLARERQPDHCGINARQRLKQLPPLPPLRFALFHLAIAMPRHDVRADVMRMALRKDHAALRAAT